MNRNQRIVKICFLVALFAVVLLRNTLGLSRTEDIICIVVLGIIASVCMRLMKDPKNPNSN